MQLDKILLSHGSGGTLMHELIQELFIKKFSNQFLNELNDSAKLASNLYFTTDSYVVNPLFFPGGDIGKLAVCGTINDLAVMGAVPLYISAGFIIEEGLEYNILEKITESMAQVAREEKIDIVTGDVKVVEKGNADKLFINTSGIGKGKKITKPITPGDKILINGPIGEHELAVLLARGEFDIKAEIKSDCAPLTNLIQKALKATPGIKFMRDPTRGGLATTLNEIVAKMDFGISIDEEKIPIKEEVKATCELLGFDPLYLANEGKVAIVSSEAIKGFQTIGEVMPEPKGKVIMKTKIGGTRIVDMLTGGQLPRIC